MDNLTPEQIHMLREIEKRGGDTVRHHYVPVFHLDRWRVGGSGSIGVLDKREKKTFQATPRNVGAEVYFYSRLPEAQVVEGWLSLIDERLAKLYRRIERKRDVAHLTQEDRGWADVLLALMAIRTRAARESARATYERVANLVAKAKGVTDWTVKVTEEGALGAHISMLPDLLSYAYWVGRLKLTLLVNRTQVPYTTSDQPVTRWNGLPPRPSRDGRFGLASQGIQLRMPISPRLCLLACDPEVYESLPSRREVHNPLEVQSERRLQLSQSWRHVFSTVKDSFSLELEELERPTQNLE